MSEHEPEATREQQERVRRLLAEARHDAPLPPEVAQRLDDVLAQLVAEGPRAIDPPAPPPHVAVDDLAVRRRRRVTGLLVAAAVVVVAGVGLGQLVTDDGAGDRESPSAAGGSAEDSGHLSDGTALDRDDAFESAPDIESAPASGSDAPVAPPEGTVGRTPRVRAGTFAADAERLRGRAGIEVRGGQRVSAEQLSSDPMFVCPAADWGSGRLIGVLFDDVPSVLAYRATQGDTITVELLQCGTATVRLSTVLPAS